MLQLEVLVTGTGRSGTGFIAKTLSEAGLPCSHEGLFGPYGPMTMHRKSAESSWLAVPFLECVDAPVVVVVREPTAVVQSLLGIGFFENTSSPYYGFMMHHSPGLEEVARSSVIDAAWTFWLRWNERAVERADVVLNLEGNWSEPLASVTGLESNNLVEAGGIVGVYNSRARATRDMALIADQSLIDEATNLYAELSIK